MADLGWARLPAPKRRTVADACKKSEIPCRTGKASLVLGVWIGNSCEQGPCRNEPEPLNPRSRLGDSMTTDDTYLAVFLDCRRLIGGSVRPVHS